MTSSSTKPVPADYHELFHPVWFLKRIALHAAVTVAVIVLIGFLLSKSDVVSPWYDGGIAVIVFPVIAFLVYRQYWLWKSKTIDCTPKDAQLRIADPINRKLLMRGSTPDRINLDSATIKTLEQSFFETYIPWMYNSQSVQIDYEGQTIILRNIVHADRLEAIQDYVKGLEKLSTEQNDRMIEQNNTIIDLMRTIGESHETQIQQGWIMIGLLQQLVGTTPTQSLDPDATATHLPVIPPPG